MVDALRDGVGNELNVVWRSSDRANELDSVRAEFCGPDTLIAIERRCIMKWLHAIRLEAQDGAIKECFICDLSYEIYAIMEGEEPH